jgi:hypothetical protein
MILAIAVLCVVVSSCHKPLTGRQRKLVQAGFRENLPKNDKLAKLLTEPIPPDGTIGEVVKRSMEIDKAVRADSAMDFECVLVALLHGSGQTMTLPTGSGEGPDAMSFCASRTMAKFGKKAIPFLVEELDAENDTQRFWAIMAIEGFGANGTDALPALQKALSDSSERNRTAAASVIQTIKAAASH